MNEPMRRITSLLKSQAALVLATADRDGQPRSTPLFFLCGEDLKLYWLSSRNSLHSRNCTRNPRVSVAVFRSARGWEQIRGVQFEGVVSVVSDRALRRELTRAYCARFRLGDDFSAVIRRCSLYAFTPQWARYLDNSRGFGYKFELKLGIARQAC